MGRWICEQQNYVCICDTHIYSAQLTIKIGTIIGSKNIIRFGLHFYNKT